ncbi:hypothetical protein NDU88_001773 [Pleurodeles waltl]|uniref:Uncharacterized protein n=1 Tax=Pleurodeles waltl TaxID=8319 RepID=A0AAV7WJD6_PLEWA|nr:hypothetical protein NDU88_001773 [Pleurodeles waltl]
MTLGTASRRPRGGVGSGAAGRRRGASQRGVRPLLRSGGGEAASVLSVKSAHYGQGRYPAVTTWCGDFHVVADISWAAAVSGLRGSSHSSEDHSLGCGHRQGIRQQRRARVVRILCSWIFTSFFFQEPRDWVGHHLSGQ